MKILGIETSCDETAAAIVENGVKILSNIVASSEEIHKKTGGIIPEVAAREQLRCIIPVIEEAIKVAKGVETGKDIDALAVTYGPGLIGSLLVGVETAKTLAYVWKKPIVPINHLRAHLYANWLNGQKPKFPTIGLVVSGGHTDLVLLKNHGQCQWLGGTRDDAAGECFDKTARVLGLGYPGGPAIASTATKYKIPNTKYQTHLPRPMINQKNFDFSFSGLKTAVINLIRNLPAGRVNTAAMAYEIQKAITDVLVAKTIRAMEKYPVKSILVSGGVAANKRLREKFETEIQEYKEVKLFIPPSKLCTDNAAIIASCAYFNYKPVPACPPRAEQKIQANPGIEIC